MLTTIDVAAKLKVSPRRVIALITSGRLPATKFGNSWMIDAESLKLVKLRKPGRPRKGK